MTARAVILAAGWAGWWALALGARRGAPPRVRELVPTVRPGRGIGLRPPLRWGAVAAVGLGSLVLAPPLILCVPLALAARPVLQRRRAARARDDAVRRELPDVVDLLILAVGAGLTVPLAVDAVGRHGEGRVAAALGEAARRASLGVRLADSLTEMPVHLGDRARPLVAALVASERYGVPALPALERLADDGRDDRRRHAEAMARRLPVKLLFPLVLCTLPAFALLTVVPLLVGSLRELRL
jgi:tight adherence protein C